MKKAQSFIVEFILFFVISFSLFATISYYFYSGNEYFKKKVGDKATDLINDLISTHIIRGVNCKACDEVTVSEEIPAVIGGFFYKVQLNENGLNTSLFMGQVSFKQTPIFNLNETYNVSSTSGEATSDNKIVEIKIDNNNKELGVK